LRQPTEVLSGRLRRQAGWCASLDSPFYAALLEAAADDLESGGPVAGVLERLDEEPGTGALALRLMGAVHRLVLDDTLPELARHYPSAGGDGDASAAWPLFRDALAEHREVVRSLVLLGCQTNEVGRSAALVGGFLEVAHRSRKPLRILEMGASAGLNLRWDRYRYESPAGAWGDPSSRVVFAHNYDVAPPLNRPAEVVERKGCDLQPIDPTSEDGSLTLRSFIWADQLGRLAQLDGAIAIASDFPIEVERIHAAAFLHRELAIPRPDVATVVFHSVFMQYVDDAGRHEIAAALAGAPDVYHLRLEPEGATFEVRLGNELLATCLPHGTHVRWNVDSSPQ